MSQERSRGLATAGSLANVEYVLRDLARAWNRHDLPGVLALHARDYEGTDVGCPVAHRGRETVGQCFARYWQAFPDLRLSAGERVVQGNQVAIAWWASGTHEGTFMNIPATSRRVTLRGVSFLTLDGGQISRGLHVWDVAGFLRAVRLLPDL